MVAAGQWFAKYGTRIVIVLMTAILISLIVAVLFIEINKPREGIVTRKEYQPAYTSVSYENTYNSKGECIGSYPVTKYYSEKYIITIKGTGRDGTETYGIYYVTPEQYEQIQVGDYYISGLE